MLAWDSFPLKSKFPKSEDFVLFTARRLPGTCLAYLLNDQLTKWLGTSQAMGLRLLSYLPRSCHNGTLDAQKCLTKGVKDHDLRRNTYYDCCSSLTIEGLLQIPLWLPFSHPQFSSGCTKLLRRKPPNDHSDFHFHFCTKMEEICYLALSRPCDFKKFISRYRERNATSWSFVL